MPNALSSATEPAPLEALAGPALAEAIGRELASRLDLLQRLVDEACGPAGGLKAHAAAIDEALQACRQIAQRSQQLARLAGGRLRQSHERLWLHTVMHDVLAQRAPVLARGGVQLRHQLRPVEVIVDPGLLVGLLEAAVDWAAAQGQALRVTLAIKHWPEHGVLVLKASAPVQVAAAAGQMPEVDGLSWHVLCQTAQAMGVLVERITAADHAVVRMEFPRTVRQLEGLTAMEMELDAASATPSSFHSESRPMAGLRVLLLSADPSLRSEVEDVCRQMGVTLDCTPTSRQATRFCELDLPQGVLVDQRLQDEVFEELRQDLLRIDAHFPVVEISAEPNMFEVSSWMGHSASRISRESVQARLGAVLALELSKLA